MTGREKCELLRSLRRKIAEMNGIEYQPNPCNGQYNCLGFCWLCDEEANHLMQELKKREVAGVPIRIDSESLTGIDSLLKSPIDNKFLEIEEAKLKEREEWEESSVIDKEEPELMGICPAPKDPILEAKYKFLEDRGIKDYDTSTIIMNMCENCMRYDSVIKTENGIRCSCLSEHFFNMMFENRYCKLKKRSEEENSKLDVWREQRKKSKL